MTQALSPYEVLGVAKTATRTEIKQAWRTLLTKAHPDKGGDPSHFEELKEAFDCLVDDTKRQEYDSTGRVVKDPAQQFADSFGAGAFKSSGVRMREADDPASDIALQVTGPQPASFTAGFEAWMRSRGEAGTATLTAESMAERFGVVKGTYASVPLPRINAYMVRCARGGQPSSVLRLAQEPLPPALEWQEVLVSMQAAPISPADLYTARSGGLYGSSQALTPYLAGMDGAGIVAKVGDGVKGLAEGDAVISLKPHFGTWRTLAVCKAGDLLKLPAGLLAWEHAALACHLCTAYRLLESVRSVKLSFAVLLACEHAALACYLCTAYRQLESVRSVKAFWIEGERGQHSAELVLWSSEARIPVHLELAAGDAVILNAANSCIGQLLVQLCAVLRLRCIALVRDHGRFAQTQAWLQGLGATAVFQDETFSKASLDNLKFFAKPKAAFDCVGGESAGRLASALAEDGELVVYGCASGKPPSFAWQSWVFSGLQVRGFNGRAWMSNNCSKVVIILEAMAKLISAGRLRVEHTEYELSMDFAQALEHAQSSSNTKVMLRFADVGVTY